MLVLHRRRVGLGHHSVVFVRQLLQMFLHGHFFIFGGLQGRTDQGSDGFKLLLLGFDTGLEENGTFDNVGVEFVRPKEAFFGGIGAPLVVHRG